VRWVDPGAAIELLGSELVSLFHSAMQSDHGQDRALAMPGFMSPRWMATAYGSSRKVIKSGLYSRRGNEWTECLPRLVAVPAVSFPYVRTPADRPVFLSRTQRAGRRPKPVTRPDSRRAAFRVLSRLMITTFLRRPYATRPKIVNCGGGDGNYRLGTSVRPMRPAAIDVDARIALGHVPGREAN
jgi:hypothetical protein